MSNWLQSSNPAFNDDMFQTQYGGVMTPPDRTTLNGVVHKTLILVALSIGAGCIGYGLNNVYPAAGMISWVLAMITTFAVFFAIRSNPQRSKFLGPIYAVFMGGFLGALTSLLDNILISRGIVTMPLGLQAAIITGSLFVSMLGLYRAGILKPTRRFVAVVSVATMGIMVTYGVSIVLSLFTDWQIPFLSLGSAFEQGAPALIGLGINAVFLLVAALWFVIDFGVVEASIKDQSPKYMEWYCAYALMTSLAWVYYESVKIAFRVAILLNNRD